MKRVPVLRSGSPMALPSPQPRRAARLPSLCGLVALALLASGCISKSTKEAQRHWKKVTLQSLGAQVQWTAGQQQMEGKLLYGRPFNLRVNVKGQGQFVLSSNSLSLVKDPWRGAVELRALHPFLEPQLIGALDEILETAHDNYSVESTDGPTIAERKTLQLTLRPASKPAIAGLDSVTEQVERYWLDAEQSFPLRYALLGAGRDPAL